MGQTRANTYLIIALITRCPNHHHAAANSRLPGRQFTWQFGLDLTSADIINLNSGTPAIIDDIQIFSARITYQTGDHILACLAAKIT